MSSTKNVTGRTCCGFCKISLCPMVKVGVCCVPFLGSCVTRRRVVAGFPAHQLPARPTCHTVVLPGLWVVSSDSCWATGLISLICLKIVPRCPWYPLMSSSNCQSPRVLVRGVRAHQSVQREMTSCVATSGDAAPGNEKPNLNDGFQPSSNGLPEKKTQQELEQQTPLPGAPRDPVRRS